MSRAGRARGRIFALRLMTCVFSGAQIICSVPGGSQVLLRPVVALQAASAHMLAQQRRWAAKGCPAVACSRQRPWESTSLAVCRGCPRQARVAAPASRPASWMRRSGSGTWQAAGHRPTPGRRSPRPAKDLTRARSHGPSARLAGRGLRDLLAACRGGLGALTAGFPAHRRAVLGVWSAAPVRIWWRMRLPRVTWARGAPP